MRRIVMFNNVSADGFFSTADGKLDWFVQEDGVYKASQESNPNIDTLLFGRKTYDMFEAYWPHALDESGTAKDPHHPEHRSAAIHDMAVFINDVKKIVFSRSRQSVTWKNSELIPELEPAKIKALKSGPGKDMMIFGSGSLVSQLTQHGLIDEYVFVVNPVILGNGRSLLRDVTKTLKLDLKEARPFPSGVVLQRYALPG